MGQPVDGEGVGISASMGEALLVDGVLTLLVHRLAPSVSSEVIRSEITLTRSSSKDVESTK